MHPSVAASHPDPALRWWGVHRTDGWVLFARDWSANQLSFPLPVPFVFVRCSNWDVFPDAYENWKPPSPTYTYAPRYLESLDAQSFDQENRKWTALLAGYDERRDSLAKSGVRLRSRLAKVAFCQRTESKPSSQRYNRTGRLSTIILEHENQAFIDLISSPHDALGRVLKCHLVVEHYLNRFLVAHFGIDNFDDVRLTFAQKAKLLPNRATAAAFVKPGIVQLNRIRNRFGHSLGADLSNEDLGSIGAVLDVAKRGVTFGSPVEAIEAFTIVACTFMIVPPAELQHVFLKAFSAVHLRADAMDEG